MAPAPLGCGHENVAIPSIFDVSKIGEGRSVFMADDHYQVMVMRQCLRHVSSPMSQEPVTGGDRVSNRFLICLAQGFAHAAGSLVVDLFGFCCLVFFS